MGARAFKKLLERMYFMDVDAFKLTGVGQAAIPSPGYNNRDVDDKSAEVNFISEPVVSYPSVVVDGRHDLIKTNENQGKFDKRNVVGK